VAHRGGVLLELERVGLVGGTSAPAVVKPRGELEECVGILRGDGLELVP